MSSLAGQMSHSSVRESTAVIHLSRSEFESLVAQALEDIPPHLAELLENVDLIIEDEPPAEDPHLLGLYEGIPLTERGADYSWALPDRITIFRIPTLGMCDSRAGVIQEVAITILHEIAHHFGIDDDRLHDLGYG